MNVEVNPSQGFCNGYNFLAEDSKEHEKNKLLQIKRRFSRIDLFLKKECAGGT